MGQSDSNKLVNDLFRQGRKKNTLEDYKREQAQKDKEAGREDSTKPKDGEDPEDAESRQMNAFLRSSKIRGTMPISQLHRSLDPELKKQQKRAQANQEKLRRFLRGEAEED